MDIKASKCSHRHVISKPSIMRTINLITLLVLTAKQANWLESTRDYSPRTIIAACNTRGASLCHNLLKDCLKNCNTTNCRQVCVGQFRDCKASAGCGGS